MSARVLAFVVAFAATLAVAAACSSPTYPPVTGGPPMPDASMPSEILSVGNDPVTCAEAMTSRSYVGCDYWPTVVANNVWSIFDFAVVVANGGATPADITISGGGGGIQTGTVAPNGIAKFYLPWQRELKGPDADVCGESMALESTVVARAGAFHLVSSIPVTVYQFNALEYRGTGGPTGKSWSSCPGAMTCPDIARSVGCYSFSNDASLLLPSTAMTGTYRVAGLHGSTHTIGTTTKDTMGAYFAVTATEDGTEVDVKLSGSGKLQAGGGVPATAPGGLVHLSLGAGDVAQLMASPGEAYDLSGSLVVANKPVQVISGIPCVQMPKGKPACDHVEESVFPAETLGKQYVVSVPTSPRGTPIGHVVRFYGNVDGTTLSYIPSKPADCPSTLAAGEVVDCGVVRSDFVVTGTHEFIVASFMLGGSEVDGLGGRGDPSESFAVSVEQYRTKYVFLAPDDYDVSFADVVGPMGAQIALDGERVPAALMKEIGQGFGVARIPLAKGNGGAHILSSTSSIGLQVVGYGLYTSYQYPGGLDLKRIAAPPDIR